MNKLEERFEEILDEDKWPWIAAVDCAKEAKDIAIEFARAADGILIDCEFNEVVTYEEAFEKFINQRYEK